MMKSLVLTNDSAQCAFENECTDVSCFWIIKYRVIVKISLTQVLGGSYICSNICVFVYLSYQSVRVPYSDQTNDDSHLKYTPSSRAYLKTGFFSRNGSREPHSSKKLTCHKDFCIFLCLLGTIFNECWL